MKNTLFSWLREQFSGWIQYDFKIPINIPLCWYPDDDAGTQSTSKRYKVSLLFADACGKKWKEGAMIFMMGHADPARLSATIASSFRVHVPFMNFSPFRQCDPGPWMKTSSYNKHPPSHIPAIELRHSKFLGPFMVPREVNTTEASMSERIQSSNSVPNSQ